MRLRAGGGRWSDSEEKNSPQLHAPRKLCVSYLYIHTVLLKMNATLHATLRPSHPPQPLQLCGQGSCGFPSPAADYQAPDLSLDELVGIRPSSSIFLMRAWGDSMRDVGIFDGDVLVVDKAKEAQPGDVVVAVVGADFVVKTLIRDAQGVCMLAPANPAYRPLQLGDGEVLEIWGVCCWVLHGLLQR